MPTGLGPATTLSSLPGELAQADERWSLQELHELHKMTLRKSPIFLSFYDSRL